MRYGFFSRTTIEFSWMRFRDDGLRWAAKCLWWDFRHSVIRRHAMWDWRQFS